MNDEPLTEDMLLVDVLFPRKRKVPSYWDAQASRNLEKFKSKMWSCTKEELLLKVEVYEADFPIEWWNYSTVQHMLSLFNYLTIGTATPQHVYQVLATIKEANQNA